MTLDFVRRWLGSGERRRLRQLVREIGMLGSHWANCTDQELLRASLSLKYRAQSDEPLVALLPSAYSLIRSVTERVLGLRHYDVQVLGGIALHERKIAEMQTGEGKTLTAMLPAYLSALLGRGVHIATANDYLAVRDANFVRPVFEQLGLTVGAIDSTTPRAQRAIAYQCDVTYGTAREFGFDFLRDRLTQPDSNNGRPNWLTRWNGNERTSAARLQRDLHFAIVDEADSILIDEARTPLVLATTRATSQQVREVLQWSARVAHSFESGTHFEQVQDGPAVHLTSAGRGLARDLVPPQQFDEFAIHEIYEHVERAIMAARSYQRDRHYVVRGSEVVIVDEFTGRMAEGREWRDGLHSAVAAKEGLPIQVTTGELARVSVQNFFRQYARLSGMTGTAWPARRELSRIYRLDVVPIPTHRQSRRRVWPDAVYGTSQARWAAVVDETQRIHQTGRPVLIGTRSIDKSEQLSALLHARGIEHRLLNARHSAQEAEIVASAGQRDHVTVATNMAGRGTDIRIPEDAAALGGLHIIGTELHESARIDRQLSGRCARQGDPGSFHQFMSLEDDIVEQGFGPDAARQLREIGQRLNGESPQYASRIRRAQTRVERKQYKQRRLLLWAEQERLEQQTEMGQDPYLDSA